MIHVTQSTSFSILSFLNKPSVSIERLNDTLRCRNAAPAKRISVTNTRNFAPPENDTPLIISQLDAYTRQLALHGTELRNLRAHLLALLAPHIALAYRNIGGRQEQVSIAYRASEEGDLYERLCASMDRDIRYGQTQNGPHRDDLDITLNGRNAAQFASEGQQRTTAISMKLAQSSLLTEETGHTPIHLIDDVFGELDPTRRIAFLQSLPADAQSLITTTHLDWLHDAPCPLPAFRLEDGTLAPL